MRNVPLKAFTKSPLKGKGASGTHSSHHPSAYSNLTQEQKDDPWGQHLGFARMEQEHLDQSSHSHHHPKKGVKKLGELATHTIKKEKK
tara:strand:- start:238 stop:501 length:264 start_codon:yes stop_codon:yes gene_type:complete